MPTLPPDFWRKGRAVKMYGKHFSSTYTGSMVGSGLHVFAVWGYIIANTEKDGHIELNPAILAAILGCSKKEIEAAIQVLTAPDSNSRSKKADGRRLIQEAAFLYFVPTYSDYREIRDDEDRKNYMREYMREYRKKEPVNSSVKPGKPPLAHTDADADAKKKPLSPANAVDCPHDAIIQLYHDVLGDKLPAVRVWTDARKKFLRGRWKENKEQQSLAWWKKFFEYVRKCPHLMGDNDRGWCADLEWLVRPNNFPKVIEGRYDARNRAP